MKTVHDIQTQPETIVQRLLKARDAYVKALEEDTGSELCDVALFKAEGDFVEAALEFCDVLDPVRSSDHG